jgi:BlaI family transcriptional regulator, penicillinase repressor
MARPRSPTLTPGELRIMRILWSRGPSSAAQIVAALRRPVPARTTVLTLLGILERKGQIAHDVDGRSFVYHATVDERTARRRILDDVVSRFFGGSRRALLLHVLEEEKISEDEARRIREILDPGEES